VANDDLIKIKEFVEISVNIMRMEIPVTAYITEIRVIYNLLLS
jgi:hypothetical protein